MGFLSSLQIPSLSACSLPRENGLTVTSILRAGETPVFLEAQTAIGTAAGRWQHVGHGSARLQLQAALCTQCRYQGTVRSQDQPRYSDFYMDKSTYKIPSNAARPSCPGRAAWAGGGCWSCWEHHLAQPACTRAVWKASSQRGLNLFLGQISTGRAGELLKENNHSQDTFREENL